LLHCFVQPAIVHANFYLFHRCTVKECSNKRPKEKKGYKIVEKMSVDDCCKTFTQIPTDCKTSKCPYQVPSCGPFEDLVSYSIDKCCSTYECKCNPSLCPEYADLPCPIGSKRVVLDSDECCAVGKCLRDNTISASAAATANTYAMTMGGLLTTIISSGESGSDKFNLGLSNAAQASAASSADASGSLRLVAETAICIDSSGKERKYGDCWSEHKEGSCQICTCYDASDIR